MVREAGDDITTRSRRERRAERTRPHSKHAHIRAPPRFPSAACAVRLEEGARKERGKKEGGGGHSQLIGAHRARCKQAEHGSASTGEGCKVAQPGTRKQE